MIARPALYCPSRRLRQRRAKAEPMIRLGIHYLEPRRIGFFVLEETALWLSYLLAAAMVAAVQNRPASLSALLAQALAATCAIEAGLYFGNLHDLKVALADAADGRKLLKVLGVATILSGCAF